MSSTRCQLINAFLYPLTLSMVISMIFDLGEYELALVRANAVLFCVMHVHYGVCLVRQMCDHFQINCFSLKRAQTKCPELENLGKRM